MVDIDPNPSRFWVAPLFVILIVGVIYVFTVFPQPRAHIGLEPLPNHPSSAYGKERAPSQYRIEDGGDEECNNRGLYRGVNESCFCGVGYRGSRCEVPLCNPLGGVADGLYCRCDQQFAGELCHLRCIGDRHVLKNVTYRCACSGNRFGPRCEYSCQNGALINGECHCHPDFEGLECSSCVHPANCPPPSGPSGSYRRSSINSRLTLSGLSFCLITIGLLCVTASFSRRRRLSSSPPDGWLSLRPPHSTTRFPCPSSFRLPPSRMRSERSQRIPPPVTPPPIYRSLENLPEGSAPPSYEEATAAVAIEIDPASEIEEDKSIASTP